MNKTEKCISLLEKVFPLALFMDIFVGAGLYALSRAAELLRLSIFICPLYVIIIIIHIKVMIMAIEKMRNKIDAENAQ